MSKREIFSWTLFLIVTAALIGSLACNWFQWRQYRDLWYDRRALSVVQDPAAWRRVLPGAFVRPGSAQDPQWQVSVIHTVLRDNDHLPEAIKQTVLHWQQETRDPNSVRNRIRRGERPTDSGPRPAGR